MLATTWREAAQTYMPIEEYGYGYGPPPHDYAYADPITGQHYYGRGYVQITGSDNYKRVGDSIGVDLYHNPGLALDAATAYKIMSKGMRVGLFTGVNLGQYITDATTDYFYARRIVLGLDHADEIREAATKFETILRASLVSTLSVATPAISPEGGTYVGRIGGNAPTGIELTTISLACVTDGATIYYTTDGSTPTTASTIYTAPFVVSQSTTVRATAFRSGYADGGVSSADFAFIATPVQLANISTRMNVETGNNVLIGGFIITGNAPKNVVVRGIGPSLAVFGINGVLAEPTLELRAPDGSLIAQNDNWQDNPTQAAQLNALGLALQDPRESGIVATLQPGTYTAILAGRNQTAGVGLVEVYDTNGAVDAQMANISTRGFVLTGNNVMIGGFILTGDTNNTRVAVRGIGPSLAQFGLNPVLADPTLELHDGNGAILVSDDNWQDDAAQAAELVSTGLAPTNTFESALMATLPPGQFTAILAGKNGGTGIGLVEIYNVH